MESEQGARYLSRFIIEHSAGPYLSDFWFVRSKWGLTVCTWIKVLAWWHTWVERETSEESWAWTSESLMLCSVGYLTTAKYCRKGQQSLCFVCFGLVWFGLAWFGRELNKQQYKSDCPCQVHTGHTTGVASRWWQIRPLGARSREWLAQIWEQRVLRELGRQGEMWVETTCLRPGTVLWKTFQCVMKAGRCHSQEKQS